MGVNRSGMNYQAEGYTIEDLKERFLEAEKKLGRIPKSRELVESGALSVSYYIKMFGSWNKFLSLMGREIQSRGYTRKENPKRFFFPSEWTQTLGIVNNAKHKFWLEFLLHTGTRFNEAKSIEIRDINFEKELILVKHAKGGHGRQRTLTVSSYLIKRINSYIRINNLGKLDTLKFPSIQYMDRIIKKYVKEASIDDFLNFSCHTLRKTLENWLVAININIMIVQQHMGHTLNVAHVHYIANQEITNDEKVLIKSILGNLFQK